MEENHRNIFGRKKLSGPHRINIRLSVVSLVSLVDDFHSMQGRKESTAGTLAVPTQLHMHIAKRLYKIYAC